MALKQPDRLTHNNPNNPLMNSEELRGGYQAVGSKSERNSWAINKRMPRMMFSYLENGEEVTVKYINSSVEDSQWTLDSNWVPIGGGVDPESEELSSNNIRGRKVYKASTSGTKQSLVFNGINSLSDTVNSNTTFSLGTLAMVANLYSTKSEGVILSINDNSFLSKKGSDFYFQSSSGVGILWSLPTGFRLKNSEVKICIVFGSTVDLVIDGVKLSKTSETGTVGNPIVRYLTLGANRVPSSFQRLEVVDIRMSSIPTTIEKAINYTKNTLLIGDLVASYELSFNESSFSSNLTSQTNKGTLGSYWNLTSSNISRGNTNPEVIYNVSGLDGSITKSLLVENSVQEVIELSMDTIPTKLQSASLKLGSDTGTVKVLNPLDIKVGVNHLTYIPNLGGFLVKEELSEGSAAVKVKESMYGDVQTAVERISKLVNTKVSTESLFLRNLPEVSPNPKTKTGIAFWNSTGALDWLPIESNESKQSFKFFRKSLTTKLDKSNWKKVLDWNSFELVGDSFSRVSSSNLTVLKGGIDIRLRLGLSVELESSFNNKSLVFVTRILVNGVADTLGTKTNGENTLNKGKIRVDLDYTRKYSVGDSISVEIEVTDNGGDADLILNVSNDSNDFLMLEDFESTSLIIPAKYLEVGRKDSLDIQSDIIPPSARAMAEYVQMASSGSIPITPEILWDGSMYSAYLGFQSIASLKIKNGTSSLNFNVEYPSDASENSRGVTILVDNSSNFHNITSINFEGNWEWDLGVKPFGIPAGGKCTLTLFNINSETVKPNWTVTDNN